MRDAVSFDMDGLLCDTSAVEHLAADDFGAFQTAAVACPPNPAYVAEARRQHDAGRAVLILTSREFIWRDHTLNWLVAAGVPHQGLYMRVVGDYRADTVVKTELIAQAATDGFGIVEAWDDSPRVRETLASLGVEVHA